MRAKAPRRDISRSDRLRYHVDLFLSRGPWARFVGLFALSLIAVVVAAACAMLVAPAEAGLQGDFLEAMWWAMTRVTDAGTMSGDQGTVVRLVAVGATMSGIFVVALLIGLVASTVGDKLEDLQRGKSPVIDDGHTLILGFGEKVFPILRELKLANASRGKAAVVILSEMDKADVEDAVRERLGDMDGTRVIVRQGSPFSPPDLRKVGAGRARSIIIPAVDDGDDDEMDAARRSDMAAIKTLLALRRVPGALQANHAVVELVDTARRAVVERLGQGGVEVVAMRDTLARLMVQTARQTGLARVIRDLLTYEGSEFYFKNFPELADRAFGDVQPVLQDAVAIGVRAQADDGRFAVTLNPPASYVLKVDDELLVLAEDDDTFSVDLDQPRLVDIPKIPKAVVAQRPPERLLVCGYRSDLGRLIDEFDRYVAPGSEVRIMTSGHGDEIHQLTKSARQVLRVDAIDADPTDPAALSEVMREAADAVLIVADDTEDPQEADARTVITLLLLRDLVQDRPVAEQPRLISEILDPRTKDLVSNDQSTDFVVSSEITSMLLAQVSENRELNSVFADLFDPDGNELYLKNVAGYALPGVPTSWMAVQAVAAARGEVALGAYRPGCAPVLGPNQTAPMVFTPHDKIIVVAEDDREGAPLPAAATLRQAA